MTKYYQNIKERLQRKAPERYQYFSDKEKNKQEYGHKRYEAVLYDAKQRLFEYRKRYCEMQKKITLTVFCI